MSSPAGSGDSRAPVRLDALAKVTGTARYAIDVNVGEMAHAAVVRSTRAHARILDVDDSEALLIPGVLAVVTADDLAGLFPRYGHIVADHPILAIDRVRYFGEPLALVVAEDRYTAHDAAQAVRVEYEDLTAVMDIDAALAEDAVSLHDERYERGDGSFEEAMSEQTHSNVAHEVTLEWGDVDEGFARSDEVIETVVDYPMLYGYAMEPYNAVARFDSGVLEVTTTAQHPYQVREDLARIFGFDLSRVRVASPYLGGGYGTKSYTKVEPLAAVGAWATSRAVKVTLDVEEAIHTTRADAARVRCRTGFTADGRIQARDIQIVLDSGAYADNSPLVAAKAVNRAFGPYVIPNLRVVGRSVYTNTVPASSYRGFGAPQGNLAGETNMDRAAEALGVDPFEIRARNLVGPGETLIPGKRPLDADIRADLEMVVDALKGVDPGADLHGAGFGCSASDAGAFPVSTATVKLLPDGSVSMLTGSTEMGQGSRTVLAQIAATELGVPLDRITVFQSDTAITPYERTTGASRTTTLAGMAIVRACEDLRRKLEQMAAEVWGQPVDQLKSANGAVKGPNLPERAYADVLTAWFGARAGEVIGNGIVRKADSHELLPPFWEIGAVGVAISIDRETGQVSVDRLVTVGDVGYAINPRLVEGQDLGAATQGLGAALYEELVYDGPQLANANVVEYRMPRAVDMPTDIVSLLAERHDGIGPYGAKGAGEGALNPIGGAVASAVARAIGRWPDRLPLTAERVWRMINDGEK